MTTSLLLHCDGTNDSTTFVDETGKTVTPNGNAKISTAQSKFGGASAYFDGNGDYLSIPRDAAFDFGTGNFTVEAWIYLAGNSAAGGSGTRDAAVAVFGTQASGNTNYWWFSIAGNTTTTGTGISFEALVSGSSYTAAATVSISQSAWHHVAAVRSAGVMQLFLDGVSQTLTTNTLTTHNLVGMGSNPLTIGASLATSYIQAIDGYIDELRVSSGDAVYTADFTPPTMPFAIPYPQAGTPTSISSTTFGTPFARYPQIGEASSIATTTFGEPTAAQSFTATDISCYVAQSIRSTTFGTPISPLRYVPESISSTRFGTPTANVLNRTGRIADGISSTTFGTPTATMRVNCSAGSINSTAFGTPAAYWSQTGVIADGIHSTTFGVPSGPARAGRGKSIFITQRPR